MAFAGLLPVLLAGFIHAHLSDRSYRSADPPATDPGDVPLSASLPVRLLPATFLVVGWIGVLALPVSNEPTGLVGPDVPLGGVLLGARGRLSTPRECRPSFWEGLYRVVDRRGYGDLFAVGVALSVAYPVVGFPAEASVEGGVINLYVHLLGFCLAFIGPYALLTGSVFDDRPSCGEGSADLRIN